MPFVGADAERRGVAGHRGDVPDLDRVAGTAGRAVRSVAAFLLAADEQDAETNQKTGENSGVHGNAPQLELNAPNCISATGFLQQNGRSISLSRQMTSDAAPLLSIESLRVQFDALVAVRDITLQLPASCLLGLIGPNGAGKTTLIRAVAGLQTPTRGLIHVVGERVVPGNTAALRHIGYTPDTPPAYEELSVRQFLQTIAKGYQLSASDTGERIDFWLEKVWLTDKADVKVKQLSRGMRQRLGIAHAAAQSNRDPAG